MGRGNPKTLLSVLLLLILILSSFATFRFTAPAKAAGSRDVSIVNFSFNPSTITVIIGVNNTITWTNYYEGQGNGVNHTVTSDIGLFDSGSLAPGATFTLTFTQTGTFHYHCNIHPFMMGTVVVIEQPTNTMTSTSTSTSTMTSNNTASITASLSSSQIAMGQSVAETATLTGVTNNAGGTVTYQYFSNGSLPGCPQPQGGQQDGLPNCWEEIPMVDFALSSLCSGSPTVVGSPVNVTNGIAPPSSPQAFNALGYYGWNAVYSGDNGNKGATSGCGLLTVHQSPLLSLTTSCNHASAVVGSTIICKVKVTGSGPGSPTENIRIGFAAVSADYGPQKNDSRPVKYGWGKVGTNPPAKAGTVSSCQLSKGVCTVKFTPPSVDPHVAIVASYHRTTSDPPYTGSYSLSVSELASKTLVSCKKTTLAGGASTTCAGKVVGYHPTGTVTWSQMGGAGNLTFFQFIGTTMVTFDTCTLSLKGSCSIGVKGIGGGDALVQGTYSGDGNNTGGSKSVKLAVQVKPHIYFDCGLSDATSAPPQRRPLYFIDKPINCRVTLAGYAGSIPGATVSWSLVGETGTKRAEINSTTCVLGDKFTSVGLTYARCSVTITGRSSEYVRIDVTFKGDAYNMAVSVNSEIGFILPSP